VIIYCQTGTRASNSYIVLRELAFAKVRVYDASWNEWGSNLSLPVDDVSYFNFVSVLNALEILQSELKDIEEIQATGAK